jgi:chromosome partitioning protein
VIKIKIISFYTHKGGTSKTTSIINIASILSNDFNKKVLVIDNDPQGNSTLILSQNNKYEDYFNSTNTIFELFTKRNINILDTIIQSNHNNNLYYIPSCSKHANTNMNIISYIDNSRILKNKIETIKDKFDYIIIDCSSNYDIVSTNAFLSSNYTIIPTQPRTFSISGLRNVIELMNQIKDFNNTYDYFILLTQAQINTNRFKELYNDLKQFKEFIPFYTSFLDIYEKAFDELKPINIYDNNINKNIGYKQYYDITKYLIEKMN